MPATSVHRRPICQGQRPLLLLRIGWPYRPLCAPGFRARGRTYCGIPVAEFRHAVIKHFNDALLATMKTGEQTDFSHRFQALAPEVDQAFDLPAELAVSVGPGWASFSPDQQNRLLDAFRRYTVVSYLANFNSYAGQSFTVSPDTHSLGSGRVVVQSRIVTIRGEATELDYVMNQAPCRLEGGRCAGRGVNQPRSGAALRLPAHPLETLTCQRLLMQ